MDKLSTLFLKHSFGAFPQNEVFILTTSFFRFKFREIPVVCRRSRSRSCPGVSPQRIGPLVRSYHRALRPDPYPIGRLFNCRRALSPHTVWTKGGQNRSLQICIFKYLSLVKPWETPFRGVPSRSYRRFFALIPLPQHSGPKNDTEFRKKMFSPFYRDI